MGVNAMSMLAGTTALESDETRVVQLLNMVTPEELTNNDDYEGMSAPFLWYCMYGQLTNAEILEDVRDECGKFGTILDLKIPRPVGGRQSAGVGKIYIKFDTPESAKKALRALAGRKFSDRTVVTTFFPEVSHLRFGHGASSGHEANIESRRISRLELGNGTRRVFRRI